MNFASVAVPYCSARANPALNISANTANPSATGEFMGVSFGFRYASELGGAQISYATCRPSRLTNAR
jgi:hypothetical protein